jgi:hypothetical protein
MDREITLFGEKNFGEYAKQRLLELFVGIDAMPDAEILRYKTNLEELMNRVILENRIEKLNVSFENKGVRPYAVPGNKIQRIFVEYSFSTSSHNSFLNMCPYPLGIIKLNVKGRISQGKLCVDLDTGYHNSFDFPDSKVKEIESDYLAVKDFIIGALADLNAAFENFNSEIGKHILPRLQIRLKKAEDLVSARNKLNF